jgi:hypothetical protein
MDEARGSDGLSAERAAMTDPNRTVHFTDESRRHQIFPTLTPPQMERLAAAGRRRRVEAGEIHRLVHRGVGQPPGERGRREIGADESHGIGESG